MYIQYIIIYNKVFVYLFIFILIYIKRIREGLKNFLVFNYVYEKYKGIVVLFRDALLERGRDCWQIGGTKLSYLFICFLGC